MRPRRRVLVTAPYFQRVVDRFRPQLERAGIEVVLPDVQERLEEAELLPLVGDVDGVISGDDRFTRRVLEAASRLKVISKWGTGIDSIDSAACKELGIAVRNTPGAFTAPVADSIVGYLLCFARQLPAMDADMRAGRWRKLPGRCLSESTVGVVGVGNIGKAVARRVQAFGAVVVGNDTRDIPADEAPGVRMVSLDELLEESDFVCLTCDLNPSSHHLIGATQLARMRHGAVLVNLARGPIVDEPALVEALAIGRIAGAALDVYEDEPLSLTSPLRSMANVMLAPHNANSSPTAWERVHESTLRNLIEVLDGVP